MNLLDWITHKSTKHGPEMLPYGGALTMADALASMDASEKAEAITYAANLFQVVTGNILASDEVADKGAAIAAATKELQALLADPTPLMKESADAEKPTFCEMSGADERRSAFERGIERGVKAAFDEMHAELKREKEARAREPFNVPLDALTRSALRKKESGTPGDLSPLDPLYKMTRALTPGLNWDGADAEEKVLKNLRRS